MYITHIYIHKDETFLGPTAIPQGPTILTPLPLQLVLIQTACMYVCMYVCMRTNRQF